MIGTWLAVADGSPFGLDNLPYGIFSSPGGGRRVGVAIGNHVLDLAGLFDDDVFSQVHAQRLPRPWSRRLA